MNKLILYQKKDGYRYNSDTIFLYYFLHSFGLYGEVLDIGCGCGILGLLSKRDFSSCSVTLLDILKKNVQISQKNAKENDLEVKCICENFLEFACDKKYDNLICNPPFYPNNGQKSENLHIKTSRYDDNLPLNEFTKKAYILLKDKGYLYICYHAEQLPKILHELYSNNFNTQNISFVYPKKDKNASLVLLRARKNAKAVCKIGPNFIASNEIGYTKQSQEIFSFTNTLSKDLS